MPRHDFMPLKKSQITELECTIITKTITTIRTIRNIIITMERMKNCPLIN